MNRMNKLCLLSMCCFSLVVGQRAWADPVGLCVELKTGAGQPPGTQTCNLFTFTNDPTDNVLSVGFSHITTTSPTGFFQDLTFGGDLPPNNAFCAVFPMLCWDSYVTIGTKNANSSLSLDPDFISADFNQQNSNATTGNGGWFAVPGAVPPLGTPSGPNNTVLLGQFTVPTGAQVQSTSLTVFEGQGGAFEFAFQCFGPGAVICGAAPGCDGPEDCNDSNPCTDDVCTAGECSNPNNTAACDDGLFCNGADTCSGGACTHAGDPCAGGAACNNACNEAADNCFNTAGSACGSNANTDCDDPDTCNGAGVCQPNNQTGPCNDGVFCNGTDTCGGGTCSVHAGDPCVGGAECNNACNETADNCFNAANSACGSNANTECDNPDSCNGSGVCQVNNEANGTSCTGGTCQGGVCQQQGCNPPDCNDNNPCTIDVCNGTVCSNTPAAAGTPCGDPSQTDCDNADTCNGSGTCLPNTDPNGTPCTPDANGCTDDVCSGGVCTHPNSAAGTACGSSTVTDCDNADTCNGSGMCLPNNDPNGTPCNPDSNECTSDVCMKGQCTHPNSPAGTACGNPADTECDNPDTCNGSGTCQANNEANGTTCSTGVCMGGNCGGCSSGAQCNDGNACTDDVCTAGVCSNPPSAAGTPCGSASNTDCDNPDACNGAGACQVNNEPNGTPCPGDGNDCTNDVCSSAVCTHPALPAGTACGSPSNTECDNPDSCNSSGTCQANNEPVGTPCSGGTCQSGGVCQPVEGCTSNAECEDNNPCTDDACVAQACVNTPNNESCDDGNFCTTGEACSGGSCSGGLRVDCNDGNVCNGKETCNPATGCVDGEDLVCNDNNVCTTDSCDPASGCVFTPNSNPCNDGNACTTGDVCHGGVCEGNRTNCDDKHECTTDSCNESTGACVHAPVNCSDDNPCTVDSCDPLSGCSYSPECVSNADCAAGEVCSAQGCCVSESVQYPLDIRSGKCPNKIKGNGNGKIKVYVAGTADLDIAAIDASTVKMRVCGEDGSIAPNKAPKVKDKVTPYPNQSCDSSCGCHKKKKDYIDDLEVEFKIQHIMGLVGPVADGTVVHMEVFGLLDDGTPFTATDCVVIDSNADNGDGDDDGEPGVEYPLDILFNKCPNEVNANSNGKIEVHIAGTAELSVADINWSTIALRECGLSGWVLPDGTPKVKDKVTPFYPQSCESGCGCHTAGKDNINDLEMKFSIPQIIGLLGTVRDGSVIHMEVFGELLDGTPFTAQDCILIKLPGGSHG